MASKKPIDTDKTAPVEEAPKPAPKAKAPVMTLDQQMVHAALNAGVEA